MREKLRQLEEKRARVREELTGIGDMRQGTLLEQRRRCFKSGCRCAEGESYAHGPSFSLTRKVEGKTVTRGIPKQAVQATKSQLARYQEFRRLSQEFLAVNEEICEAKLTEPGAEADRAQKKTLRRHSKPR